MLARTLLLVFPFLVTGSPVHADRDGDGDPSALESSASSQERDAGKPTSAPTSRRELLLERRRRKAEQLEPYAISEAEARVLRLEEARFPQAIFAKGFRGLRPVIGGMPSGSGFVAGGGYVYGLGNQPVQFQANGRLSTRGYRTADAEIVWPPPQFGRRIELKLRGEYRDLTALGFFGLGNDSVEENQSTYLLNDQGVTAFAWLNPRGLLSFGAQAGYLRARTDSGEDDASIEARFDPRTVPGFLDERTSFAMTGGWVELDIRDKWEEPPVGIVFRATGAYYEDTDITRYDFSRWVADLKAYVPLGPRNRIFAFRFRTSHSVPEDGKEVPFYLMETLGGARTIRGFREYRFRDTRNLVLSAEYRWEVWPYLDFTFFFDSGKVFSDPDDFDLSGLHTGYGFGMRIHSPEGMVVRFDLARSVEGLKLHISGGPSF